MSAGPLKSETNRSTLIAGSFAPAGAGSPTDLRGVGFTVSRVSQGLFRVTTTRKARTLVSGVVGIQLDASTSLIPSLVDVSPTTGVYDIHVVDAADTAQDVAAHASNRINFMLLVSDDEDAS